MDQRAKGGPSLPPPSTPPLLLPAPPQQYPEKEGRDGSHSQARERSCTEGNVRLRIGVQTAKRIKKPPRTLEGYEYKPTIRTYQRPGRGAAGRGDQEGRGSGQGNSPQEEGDGEQNQGSDPNTTQTRKIHSSSPPPSSPPSSSSSSSSTAPTTTTPSPANPQTAPAKQTHDQNRNRGSRGGGDTVQEVIEAVIRRQRRRRRKRRRIEEEEKEKGEHPPCLQSSGEGEPVTHTPAICTGQSELSQAPSLTPASQSDKGADQLPRKRFQRAGLYSDDYKTTDPSSQSQLNRERLEYTPGEQDYSLLPAPIHVGKYLRMRRIDFQLPFDVLWLFRHNQLHKEPDVPLTREISSCQPKEKSLSSHQTGVSLPPSPLEEGSSPSKKLFPHLDMEPMTTSDRVFVLKQHVFLLRNWERVSDRQIRLRRGREGEREKEGEKDGGGVSSDVATGDNNSHIMSGRRMVVKKKVVLTSEPLRDPQCPPNPLSTTPHLTQPQNRREEKKQGEEEGQREVRKERLNNILLKLRQA
ncbi:hypothetical protein J4Q44_G00024920 [Coregonus suidteri]|uniref:Uncharacterized protein n=1 Tax=Coregonus suidteri TaxID=861788 RepID=A0AAN8MGS0_9TELE